MASWISLVVLSVFTVSTLSLPGPDGAYNIPQVGTGRRSQYFVLHRDGTYKYGHDTGEGAFESAKSTRVGQQDGRFGYVDPDGNSVNLQYTAGEAGFVPSGSHLPQPHPDFHKAHAAARARPPFVDPLANPNADASYGFQFAGEGQTRSEQSDATGNVRGSYSYTDDDGITRTYSYTAGRGTGFVVEGNDLPLSPPTPESSPSTPAATRQSSSGARFPSSSRPTGSLGSPSSFSSSSSPGYRPPAAGSAPSSSSVVAVKSASGTFSSSQSGASSSQSSANDDGSYSFSFNAADHSRSESADADLNVQGQFSFVADDGVRRRVDYQAGANRGFTASGDHLPTAPTSNTPASSQSSGFHGSSRPSTYRAPSASPQGSASTAFSSQRPSSLAAPQTYSSGARPSSSSSRPPFEEANTRSELRPDGSYAFAYETSTHSRKEAGDTNNNVDGDFAFVADDGQRRQIQYQAGSDTGFIAEGSHIPVGPIVPGAPSGQPTGRITPVKEVPFIDPLANSNADASYNFAFDSEQYSRSETADADGNVRGTYTVVDDDGTRRTVRFRAGEGIGFEPQEVSSSRGPPPSRKSLSSSSPSHRGTVGSPFSPAGAFAASPSSQVGTFSSSSPSGSTRPSSPSQYSAPSSQRHSPENFKLTQYDASKNPNKFGYVLTFN
ncbi:nuclear pore complex protein DDB_G0274915-like [Macrobrachium nipponense]|uniref:nuclear pore complex protein DDB_G0274915-like n=1 Tax=Macrobrachium nipponense TaxID=159736 RepID=UPI0030C80729